MPGQPVGNIDRTYIDLQWWPRRHQNSTNYRDAVRIVKVVAKCVCSKNLLPAKVSSMCIG